MSVEVKVPPVGESISSVVVARWMVQPGESVKEGTSLVELETDKVNVEVPAPVSGKLSQILKQKGESASISDVLALMEAGPVGASSAPTQSAPTAVAPAPTQSAERAPTPSAQRMIAEHQVATPIQGTGKAGQVIKEDVQRVLAQAPTAQAQVIPTPAPSQVSLTVAPTGSRTEEVVAMAPMRKTIARRLVEAQQTAALLTTFNEVDMSNVSELRKRYQEEFQTKYGTKLGFMSFFVKAAVEALKAFPAINAEIRGDQIAYRNYYDVGVAVGGGKGLVVPVLRNAERMSFSGIETAIKDFGTRAQNGKIKLEELQGGTFTISNGGVYGSLLSTPIVNPPQSGVLGLHKIQDRPIALNGQVVIRPMMYLALTYDHRLVDGREAVSFLIRIKDCIENPTRLLLEL
jgi:2-oxoglutarate dehydrogenase E2 component (dihydrolipoamide succinyltransferase)